MPVAEWSARTSLVGALLTTTCCVLPSVLVALGAGGAVASVVSALPAVAVLGTHKLWVFVPVGGLLLVSWGAVTGRVPTAWARARLCPAGPAPRRAWRVWRVAAALYLLSVGMAYLGAPVARLIWR